MRFRILVLPLLMVIFAFAKNSVDVGVRPFYLVDQVKDLALQKTLKKCVNKNMHMTDFSIGHRGAALQFPEHTRESYLAAAKMGAGIIECDVTFTKDKELVCRHSQCDLHSTTNILATDLAQKCSVPPKIVDGKLQNAKDIKCCTTDITLAEFKSLKGKMDAANTEASTIEEYMNATPSFRTDLYSFNGELMTHKESIELFKKLGVKMTPELKSPSVPMPFNGMSQEDYAKKMISEYKKAGVPASKVFPQSFNYSDILYWIKHEPNFGKQAVWLDGRYGETDDDVKNFANFNPDDPKTWEPRSMKAIKKAGINYIAPPLYFLVKLDGKKIVPSAYSKAAKKAGLKIITWTLERSGLFKDDNGGWYYQSIKEVANNPGVTYELLHVLNKDVQISGIFSDWPATVTFYKNCVK